MECIFASLSKCDKRSQFPEPDANWFGLFWLDLLPDGVPHVFFLTTEIDMIIPDLDCGYEGMMVGISFYFRAGGYHISLAVKCGRGRESDWNS